jgi:hypothetical protein
VKALSSAIVLFPSHQSDNRHARFHLPSYQSPFRRTKLIFPIDLPTDVLDSSDSRLIALYYQNSDLGNSVTPPQVLTTFPHQHDQTSLS